MYSGMKKYPDFFYYCTLLHILLLVHICCITLDGFRALDGCSFRQREHR
uniref:Uncharacterized protein n=1 Tax=Anguilla anguilla TaxID=7936 RepID=A0A0E9XUK4_ANGAN